jgi:two-component system, OmpR family, sensor kinase
MNLREEDKGIAFLCAGDGTILRIIRDELGLPAQFRPGATIVDMVDASLAGKARAFLAAVTARSAVFDWELGMQVAGRPTPMHFAGIAEGDHLFVVAARSFSGLARFNDELVLINNEQTNALRSAVKELSLQTTRPSAEDSFLYEDLSRVNNELATLQRELTRKNAELEKVNEQKNRFLGMAAHDLRNPLGVIRSYSEFLQDEAGDTLNDEQREFVTIIRETSEFMLRLVSDLLDVAAIESGQLTLDAQPTDLGQLIRQNVTLNRVLAARKDIAVEFDPPPTVPMILLDRGKIEQVLNNLLSNAVKFSHRGTVVRVRLTWADDLATVTVRDQGQGIPAADLPKLFKPFSRASVHATDGEQSTGLGLAIVRRIIEGHGGRIWVESEVGTGSTFSFALPLVASAARASAR